MTRGDEGQAAVELALVTPLLFTLLLAVVQVGLVVRDQVLVVHVAREGAREAAVRSAVEGAAAASRAATDAGLVEGRASVDTDHVGGMVRVRVRYSSATDVPLIGPLLPDVTLISDATMRQESPAM
ncbi:MAG: hypothetical protein AVDCRST_MAG50-2080 [uncultured Acidimicrobiales bacterium]|uniref:TadE-like domain-containing protein n=1 Tax=uncultured Acidimicrobiales bacterium TaxID=310071 RepID=A0A6J4IE77_9ACTN|nr:MAG: hypothetical protein AVDCRST_MAG50-2080 [uncultured Acidimicrobiales bacterium]